MKYNVGDEVWYTLRDVPFNIRGVVKKCFPDVNRVTVSGSETKWCSMVAESKNYDPHNYIIYYANSSTPTDNESGYKNPLLGD